jgi:DNA-binding CsgD family transcriptional regulator
LHINTENISKNSPKLAGPEIFDKNGQPIELTTRENECLYYLLAGKSAKQTAAILNISQRTVEFHLDNIKLKAGCRTKIELAGKVKAS